MKKKNDVEVLIDGRKYTLCGFESPEYIQKDKMVLDMKHEIIELQDTIKKLEKERNEFHDSVEKLEKKQVELETRLKQKR